MAYIPLEKLTKKNSSLYTLVLAAAERANEINQGAEPLVPQGSKSCQTVALVEFAEGKVHYVKTAKVEKVEKTEKEEEPK